MKILLNFSLNRTRRANAFAGNILFNRLELKSGHLALASRKLAGWLTDHVPSPSHPDHVPCPDQKEPLEAWMGEVCFWVHSRLPRL